MRAGAAAMRADKRRQLVERLERVGVEYRAASEMFERLELSCRVLVQQCERLKALLH
jgi:hypothetical protein